LIVIGKKAFLQRLTAQNYNFKSLRLDSPKFEGSSPPSVFIGRENYPKVFAGPMLAQEPDSFVFDAPEQWLGRYGRQEIIGFRLQLVRGMKPVDIHDTTGRFGQQLQDIALSKQSLFTHAEFEKVPRGVTFSEDHQPFGPSAQLSSFETEQAKWQHGMEKAYYDTDLLAQNAVLELSQKGLPFTSIQKALSVGAFGKENNRKFVPTRWSITATDDILGKDAMQDVRQNELIDEFRVYESNGLHNYFSVLLTPNSWQYEAIEAFINIMGNKTFTFSDAEGRFGRKEYSDMGGCYYAQRNVVADFLKQKEEQAGAFVFREVYPGYTPTGVWLCRELTKQALSTEPKTFSTMSEATHYIDTKLKLGAKYHKDRMKLVNEVGKQRSLLEF
jgi:hypothetical protein